MKRAKAEGRAALLATLTEKEWQRQVCEWANRGGWRVFHVYNMVRSAGGWPDLVLVKPKYPVIYAELKTVTGRVSAQQQAWLDDLAAAHGTTVSVWRPQDDKAIKALLLGSLAAGQPNAGETDRYDCGRNGTPRCPTWPACEHGDLPFAPLEREGIA